MAAHGTLHGSITDTGGENCDFRGFVWDTSSHGLPGNVAPGASGYALGNWTEEGTYGVDSFSHQVTGLAEGDTFYVRACAHNSEGWSYGGEESFATPQAIIVIPSTLALNITTYIPTIAITAHKVVTPPKLALVLTAYAPVVTAIGLEALRPNAIGAEANLDSSNAINWQQVNEVEPDAYTSYVRSTAAFDTWNRDLYNVTDSAGLGDINFIKVYAHCRASETPNRASLKIAIKSGTGAGAPDTLDERDEKTLTTSWADYSEQWDTNPATGVAWTWDEIDNLQAGLSMRGPHSLNPDYGFCTQVYVETDYTPYGPVLVTPGTLPLSLTTYAPTVGAPILVTPLTLALSLTTYSPVVFLGQIATPSTLALALTTYVPTIIFTRTAGALRYVLELHNSNGDLVSILQNAHNIAYAKALNEPTTLAFALPADDAKAAGIILANEIWLRDNKTNVVMRKFRLNLRRDIRR